MKLNRLRLIGNKIRADEKYVPKNLIAKLLGKTPGKLRLWWREGMDEDTKKIVAPNWNRFERDREGWQSTVGKV